MRAVAISFMVVCITLALTITNEADQKYYDDYGRYFIGGNAVGGHVRTFDMNDTMLNDTLNTYGSNKVPAGLYNSPYLFYGGGLIDGLKMFFDFIGSHTIGMGSYAQRVFFPSMLPSLSYGIGVVIFIINIVAIITILRGVYVGKG